MSDERARLFVALELPSATRETLARWRGRVLEGRGGIRPVERESLHLTLCFLGARAVAEVDEIAACCELASAYPAASLVLAEGIWLPPRRPRVLAVRLQDDGGRLAAVQAALSDALAAGGFYEPESRPFLAHVTVARVGRGVRVARQELPDLEPETLRGTTVTLYRSRLGRSGARYEALHTVELAG